MIYVVVGLVVFATALAIYEKRKGITLRDERSDTPQTEADREAERTKDVFLQDRWHGSGGDLHQ